MKGLPSALIVFALFFLGCADPDDHPRQAAQAGGSVVSIPSPIGLPSVDRCQRGDDRLVLVGISFSCPNCQYGGSVPPETRPSPSLSTEAAGPWAPQLIRAPAGPYYWEYRHLQVSAWIATVEAVWSSLHPADGGALSNFRYPTPSLGWLLEPNPLWMRWKTGRDDSFVTDRFDSAGRMLYGDGTISWGSANMVRGGYRPPDLPEGIWYERWLLLCRDGGIAPTDALPYLDMHLWPERLTHQVTIRRHASGGGCPRVTYSCVEQLVPVSIRVH